MDAVGRILPQRCLAMRTRYRSPFQFSLLLILEWTAARKLESIETAAGPGSHGPPRALTSPRDLVASIRWGWVSIATTAIGSTARLCRNLCLPCPGSCPPTSVAYPGAIAIVGVDSLYYPITASPTEFG